MPTLVGTTALTLADWAKRQGDDDRIATIIEILSLTNEVLDDALFVECNSVTGHKTVQRTSLPSATWRLLNNGVPNGKSTTATVMDAVGNLETYAVIDKDLADLNGNTAEFRMSEVAAFLEGMSQQVATTMIYGDQKLNPERFTGLAARYYTTNTATDGKAANVIDAGGLNSTNTSIWIVTWGERTLHGIFPKGKVAGLRHTNMGEWPVTDANGNTYQAYRDHFKWEIGLALRDWRYCVRVCNIDVSLLATASAPNLFNMLVRGLNRLPTTATGMTAVQSSDAPSIRASMGRTVIYCNRIIRTYLELQAMNKSNVLLQIGEVDGMPFTKFRGVPIKTVDAILNTEARVV